MNTFVTGGARGIGKAIVLKMVEKGCGCAFTYRTNDVAAEELVHLAQGVNDKVMVRSYQMDVRNSQDVEEQIERAIADFKDFGVVVNNAATVRNKAAVLMSDEEWEDVLATNLSGPFYVIRSFLMHLIARRSGRIINISSLAQDGSSGQVNYAASKAGLIGLTMTLAKEYGSRGITSNAVAVGYIETDMSGKHMAKNLQDYWLQFCPVKRAGNPEEIASLVYYLSTEEASFINGEIIRADGGLTYVL